VKLVLGFLFVGLWSYGLHRLMNYDALKGVKKLADDAHQPRMKEPPAINRGS
jgi:hypothetical protein